MPKSPRRAAKVDADQPEFVERLRKQGYSVEPGHDDILVGMYGLTLWIEYKSVGGKPTDGQRELHKDWKGSYLITGQWGVDHAVQDVHRWFSRYVGRV